MAFRSFVKHLGRDSWMHFACLQADNVIRLQQGLRGSPSVWLACFLTQKAIQFPCAEVVSRGALETAEMQIAAAGKPVRFGGNL